MAPDLTKPSRGSNKFPLQLCEPQFLPAPPASENTKIPQPSKQAITMRGPQGSNVPLMSPSACSQCGQDLPNLDEVRPEIAEYIKELHSQLCAGSSGGDRVRVAQHPTASGTQSTSAPLSGTLPQPPRNAVASKSLAPAKRKKYETDTMERKAILEADIWAEEVAPHSITCRGCSKKIKLDKRNEYYPGLWVKHRDKCAEIMISQGAQVPPRKPRKKSATKSTDRVMGDTIPVAREISVAKAHARGTGAKSASRVRAFSPYSRSSTRSTSSSIGSSTDTASTHRSRVEVARSLRIETATPPPERREFDYGARPVARSPPARIPFEGTRSPRYTLDLEPSMRTATPPQERHEFDYYPSPVARSPPAWVPSGGTRSTRYTEDVERSMGADTPPPDRREFDGGEKFLPTRAPSEATRSARYTQDFEPSTGTATPPPERRESDYGTTKFQLARVPYEGARPARYTHDDELSTSNKGYTFRSPMPMQESHGEARVGSDRYWSEAPFDGGSGQSRTGLYRYSTRWELMHVFPSMHGKTRSYENDDSDEEMVPPSP